MISKTECMACADSPIYPNVFSQSTSEWNVTLPLTLPPYHSHLTEEEKHASLPCSLLDLKPQFTDNDDVRWKVRRWKM